VVTVPTVMAARLTDPTAALPFADPTASHIAAIHQSSDANVCDRNQNGRAENQGKHSLGRR
jgi:hypothetical protein